MKIVQTALFATWFKELRDEQAKRRIQLRIDRLEIGLFGDVKFFGGIGEIRIDHGPGYRVYFAKRGDTVVILLCGGNKKTQSRDIAKAQEMAKEV
jgi:putative addiction module killer protein